MGYVAENGKSALFHEQYINQRIAFRLSTLFSRPPAPIAGVGDARTLCGRLEHVNDMYGFNLTASRFPALEGTLQTQNADCQSWVYDIGAILAIDDGIFTTSTRYIFQTTVTIFSIIFVIISIWKIAISIRAAVSIFTSIRFPTGKMKIAAASICRHLPAG